MTNTFPSAVAGPVRHPSGSHVHHTEQCIATNGVWRIQRTGADVSHLAKRTGADPPRRLRRGLGLALLAALGSLVVATEPALGSTDSNAGASGTTVGASVAATAAGEAAASPAKAVAAPAVASTLAAPRPVLRQGSTGTWVTTLQRRLHGLGYDSGAMDGNFGSDTLHAVVAFQKVNNLARDGVVGHTTWASLDAPLIPKPGYNHAGLAVEVRLDKQVLFLTRANKVVRIVDASSGKASTPTPTGNFTDQRHIDGWRQSDLGLLWRPHYFTGGYAVHGSTSVPNYPASHGCVRVTIEAMNRLWTVLQTGMPVHVYYR
jgi:peptidoglycan hydrolase-like protein with peptidoglycan-binding domain